MWHGSIDVALFVGQSTEMWLAKKLTFYQNDRKKGGEGGETGVDGDDNFRGDTTFTSFTAFFGAWLGKWRRRFSLPFFQIARLKSDDGDI